MSEGLSRRRGHGGSSALSSGHDNDDRNGLHASTSSNNEGSLSPTMDGSIRRNAGANSSNGGGQQGSGSNSSSKITGLDASSRSAGHKIAYDPNDLDSSKEEAELPKLTLMEEIILLGIKE